jgi:hypothetical protein
MRAATHIQSKVEQETIRLHSNFRSSKRSLDSIERNVRRPSPDCPQHSHQYYPQIQVEGELTEEGSDNAHEDDDHQDERTAAHPTTAPPPATLHERTSMLIRPPHTQSFLLGNLSLCSHLTIQTTPLATDRSPPHLLSPYALIHPHTLLNASHHTLSHHLHLTTPAKAQFQT